MIKKNSIFSLFIFLSLLYSRVVYAQDIPPNSATLVVDTGTILKMYQQDPTQYRVIEGGFLPQRKDEIVTYYWNVGTTISIRLTGGSPRTHELIRETAKEWLAYANIKFDFVEGPLADVRIKIIEDGPWQSSYTYLGTSCKTVDQEDHTMQLYLSPNLSDEVIRATILHEFGHMLGLPAENFNPNAVPLINWEKLRMIVTEKWGLSESEYENHFTLKEGLGFLYARKPFDPNSIMMHALPDGVLIDSPNGTWKQPMQLSDGDKQFISQVYPKENEVVVELRNFAESQVEGPAKNSFVSVIENAKKSASKFNDAILADTLTDPGTAAPSRSAPLLDSNVVGATMTLDGILKNYIDALTNGRETPESLGKAFVKARDQLMEAQRDKSVYGGDDQYSPETYRQIFENAASVGALSTTDGRLGTCFMVGNNVVMTCKHCIEKKHSFNDEYRAEDLSVRFDDGRPSAQEEYPVSKIVFKGGRSKFDGIEIPFLDFAILELSKGSNGKLPTENGIRPLLLRKGSEPARYTPVYVIGFPGYQLKTVADNATIYASFDNTFESKAALELELMGEIALIKEEAMADDSPTREQKIQLAVMLGNNLSDTFKKSFNQGSSGNRWYFVSHLQGSSPQPAFALDSDTFHGNSGSPVFVRKSGAVLGILNRGSPDQYRGKVSWQNHEEAIPIRLIVDHWEQLMPGEPAKYGVSIR